MSRPIQPSGTSIPFSSLRSASAEKESPITRSVGRRRSQSDRSAASRTFSAREMPSSSTSESPVPTPRARKKLKHIAPPTRTVSAISRKRSRTPTLSDTFAPPRTTTSGRSGSSRRAVSSDSSRSSKQARVGRQEVSYALGRRVRAMGGAERVVDIEVRQRGESARRARGHSRSPPPPSGCSRAAAPGPARAARPPPRPLRPRRPAPAPPARSSCPAEPVATGRIESSGRGPSAAPGGRPGPPARPARSSSSSVGSAARMRVSSVHLPVLQRDVQVGAHEHAPPSTGASRTLSPRRRGQAPAGWRSRTFAASSTHAVRVAPLVVVPGDGLHHRPLHHHRQPASKIEECGSSTMSVETIGSSV